MNREFYEEDVKRIFRENSLTYEWWVQDNGNIVIVVEWGDWKHDHAFLQNIMEEKHYILIERNITEEDGSDAFSAEYVYKYGC